MIEYKFGDIFKNKHGRICKYISKDYNEDGETGRHRFIDDGENLYTGNIEGYKLISKNLTLQEKINKLIPNIGEKFIELDFEFDFSPRVRFHIIKDGKLIIPKEFEEWIEIDEVIETKTYDFDKLKELYGNDYMKVIKFGYNIPKKKGKNHYGLIAVSRLEETGNYRTRDDIDFILDKVIEFIELIKNKNDKSKTKKEM